MPQQGVENQRLAENTYYIPLLNTLENVSQEKDLLLGVRIT